MEKTKEQLEEDRKKIQKLDHIYGVLVVSGALIVVIGLLVFDSLTITFLGMIPTCIAIIFIAPRMHCPYCGRYLRMKFGLPTYCPFCKKKLTGDEE